MIWMLNEQLMDEQEIQISVTDHGFLYGVGLFETFRVYDCIPFLFEEHMNRLQTGLKLIGIDFTINIDWMNYQLNRLLKANNIINAYIRLTITAGSAPIGLPTKKYDHPNIIWQIKELVPFEEVQSQSKKAVILKTKRNLPETEVRLKSLNFLNHIVAKQEILEEEQTEGIFLTQNNDVAEGIVSNLFYVKEGIVYTPSLDAGILNGITRQHIITLCQTNHIPIIEGLFSLEHLLEANEIFITNSIQEVVPIYQLNNMKLVDSSNNITNAIIRLYKASIKEAIKKIEGK